MRTRMAMKRTSLIIGFPVVLGLIAFIILLMNFYKPYTGPEVQFTINPGEGFSSVNAKLINKNIITSPRLFHRYTQFKEKMTALKAGTYNIPSGVTMGDVLMILTEGTPILAKITIPEGKNMYEIAKMFEEKEFVSSKEFISLCKSPELIKMMGISAPSLEGYLFPETYMFAPGSSAKDIILTMLNQYKAQTKELDFSKTNLTPHQVVTLASIVEKETGAKWERPLIAGVYLNRLKKRMRLQADPTTIYGIWEQYNGNLKRKHLLQKTPYNTYKISGLPLGPIANPSLAAIKAVLEPEDHNYIYFVSKNDGTHVFTSTYKEHLKAVDYWQRNRRNRQGKSWRDLKQ